MEKNRGLITIEACFIVPFFLFFMLSIAGIYMVFLADAHIHQSLAEAAGETAQYAYLKEGYSKALLYQKFRSYLGTDAFVEKIVKNGKNGILITVQSDTENEKIFIAKARYIVSVTIPVFGRKEFFRENQIKQKTFVGYSKEEGYGEEDAYVYITPEQSVYHTKRSCTHLSLSIHSESERNKGKYEPCHFCSKQGKETKNIYVSKTNNIYHCNRSCSGLKRTIMRVRKSEVGGLSVCTRCGK